MLQTHLHRWQITSTTAGCSGAAHLAFDRATPCLALLAYLSVSGAFSAVARQPVTPVAQWNFEEGRGAQRFERVSGIEARIHGATWVKHGTGFALRFDGIDDYIDGGEPPLADLRGPLTLETWVHPDRPAKASPAYWESGLGSMPLPSIVDLAGFTLATAATRSMSRLPWRVVPCRCRIRWHRAPAAYQRPQGGP